MAPPARGVKRNAAAPAGSMNALPEEREPVVSNGREQWEEYPEGGSSQEAAATVTMADILARMISMEKENAEMRKENAEMRKENAEMKKGRESEQHQQQSVRSDAREPETKVGEASSSGPVPLGRAVGEEKGAGGKRRKEEEVKGSYRAHIPNDRRRRALLELTVSPFTEEVLSVVRPEIRDLPSYNGTTDPMMHLYQLQNKAGLGPEDGMVLCRLFPLTLVDEAMVWYQTLERGSIGSFAQLSDVFSSQYMCHIPLKKQVNELFAIKQHRGEKIREYVKRFSGLHCQVRGCSSSVAAMAFRAGLLEGTKFHLSLHAKPPADLAEVYERAESAMALEELKLTYRPKAAAAVETGAFGRDPRKPETASRGDRGQRREPRPDVKIGREENQRGGRSGSRPAGPEERRQYLKLNTDVITIWENHPELFRTPHTMAGDPSKRDQSKRCQLHQDYGHNTRDCLSLKGQIDAMVRKGQLGQYAQGYEDRQVVKATPSTGDPGMRIINVIHGVQRPLKRKERETGADLVRVNTVGKGPAVITFSPADYAGVQIPHEDSLVIELTVGGCRVKRVLVDNGSGADILFLDAAMEMGISMESLKKTRTPLTGFSGEHVQPVGSVTLPVTGAGKRLEVEFLVVDSPSAYNMIMGRGWIHRMDGVPSTLHQVMRC